MNTIKSTKNLEDLERGPDKVIPVPEEQFEAFYQKFDRVEDIIKTQEWQEIYSNYYEFTDDELEIDIHETVEEMELYSQQKQIQEIIKCSNNFQYFCHKYIKILHPMMGQIPFITYSYQRRVIEAYETHRFNILSKFRQGGLTTVSVLWSLWKCMFRQTQKILVMSKTDREAVAAAENARVALEHFPEWLKPKLQENNKHEKKFADTGSYLWFYTPEAARGKSISILVIDEAAFIPDMETHWKSMYPVISTGGQCCVISTVHGLGNWYEETYHSAQSPEDPFNIIDIDYWEHPVYNDPEWVRENKANLGEKGWLQEVLRYFLGSGDTYFPSNIIEELDKTTRENEPLRIKFQKWTNEKSERELKWEDGALWLWEEPKKDCEYILSADCAEGVGDQGDNNCFQIIESQTLNQVAEFYSNTVPPHVFAQIINEISYYYNTALVIVENMGPGSAVINSLQHDLTYENLHFEDGQKSPGVKPNRINRPVFLEGLQSRLLNRTLQVNSRRLVTEIKTFQFNPKTKRAEAQKGKHDDAIMSMCMAIYVRDSQNRGLPLGAEMSNTMLKSYSAESIDLIKQEIRDGAPEDWAIDPKEEEDFFMFSMDNQSEEFDALAERHRPNQKLLKEFGF